MTALLVALGAAVGAPLRYLVDQAVQRRSGGRFPLGTLVVNVVGSLVLGFLVGLPVSTPLMALLGTGFCGALTTYSTFGFETFRLLQGGRWVAAVGNAAVSLTLGLGAAFLGLSLA
ncbi:CrcB protein [Actinokineospora spheciospongiae]|uniref:Fluoride-specific ion channel FluC n=1 Tax=Actinokineospora spheciospongiae TaxID=909613 RepID=W7IU24_9PSEU|nr:fluoride efflux transporter CrcB [Actinokineospora spheciospongiae]EWC60252.1 CrcB protein [Actinokineospora spheciospongiae]